MTSSSSPSVRQPMMPPSRHCLFVFVSTDSPSTPRNSFLVYRASLSSAIMLVTTVSGLPDKVKAIAEFPLLTTLEALQKFLGMINYYRRFILALLTFCKPLVPMLKKFMGPFEFSAAAFAMSKKALVDALAAHTSGPERNARSFGGCRHYLIPTPLTKRQNMQ